MLSSAVDFAMFRPRGLFSSLKKALFAAPRMSSMPPAGFGLGSRVSPFLGIHRLSALQHRADTRNLEGAVYDRIGRNMLVDNLPEAIGCFERGAVLGNADCAFGLGMIAALEGAPEGHVALKFAANRGHPRAQFFYGGVLVEEDDCPTAMRHLRMAAESGYDRALFTYACFLLHRAGWKHDATMAFAMFRKAAQQGHPLAMMGEGMCLHNGFGVERNSDEATKLFQKAEAHGVAKAAEALKIVSEDKTFQYPFEF
jgi:TPR repeat protein